MQTEKAKSSHFDTTRGFKNQIFPTNISSHNIFRDNGIVISISVVQCSVEFILMITCSFYIYFLNGYSKTFDKFFNIYLSIVTVIILPTFYLNGEAAFRRNLAAYGPLRALKNAIVGKL